MPTDAVPLTAASTVTLPAWPGASVAKVTLRVFEAKLPAGDALTKVKRVSKVSLTVTLLMEAAPPGYEPVTGFQTPATSCSSTMLAAAAAVKLPTAPG